ncbi:MAG: phage holin family protein [Candidatus Palauibacterales bacterium]|nr:phage holin family protein [Candidatus Palauibacterales bacterium]MDP2531050.1 phage holin family protein [Candidatus Palauibacterales bacterium]MDP2585051.1 phage holin family protein [Candidatus Palauibacterales bacterium]
MRFLINWLINAAALWLTAWLIPGIVVDGTRALLLAALVIGLVNAIVKPVLVFLTFPITLLTLGIFYLVLNGLLFYLAAAITPGFRLSGFGAAFLGALVMSIVGLLLHAIVPGD